MNAIDTRTNYEIYTIAYEDATFRKYQPEISKDRNGNLVQVTLCECLEEGRWEPFVSVRTIKNGK